MLQSTIAEILEGWRFDENVEISLLSGWSLQEEFTEKIIANSPSAEHLKANYFFIQREDLANLEQSEQVVARNHLVAELNYLLDKGVEWSPGTSERDLAYALDLLRGQAVFGFPAETVLRMPQFGIADRAKLSNYSTDLQAIRLEFLLEYAPHELRRDQCTGLLRDPRFASENGQSFLRNMIAGEEASMRDLRYMYLRALAEVVNAPTFPEFN